MAARLAATQPAKLVARGQFGVTRATAAREVRRVGHGVDREVKIGIRIVSRLRPATIVGSPRHVLPLLARREIRPAAPRRSLSAGDSAEYRQHRAKLRSGR